MSGCCRPNAEIVFSLNFKQILDSEVVKSQKELINQLKAAIADRIPGDDQTKQYLEMLGFDPFKDLHSVTAAHSGGKEVLEDLLILMEGNFDAEKLAATAKEAAKANGDALKITKIGKVPVYEVSVPGQPTGYVALVGKTMVVAFTSDMMKDTVAWSGGTRVIAPKVSELLKTTKDTQSLNLVITGKALGNLAQQAGKQAEGAGPALAAIDGGQRAITIAKNIKFQLGVEPSRTPPPPSK